MGIARAVTRNLSGGGGMQGGSTITQQLAKNLFLTQERTFSRKIQEAILAVWLEKRFSKDQILELYMNRVYFGSGAYGVEAAAQRYFGRSARNVSLAESAVLAGLMVAPSRLAPNRNPNGAAERATLVIMAMARENFITEGMAKIAMGNPAGSVRHGGAGSVNYVADYVVDLLDETIGAIDNDIVVRTTRALWWPSPPAAPYARLWGGEIMQTASSTGRPRRVGNRVPRSNPSFISPPSSAG
jgi:penicillin-binding protein 1A